MRRLRSHLSYANVTATLALFVAVSGAGAYAAGLAPKSVGAPELRPGAVTAVKLRKNAVVTPKIKAKAVTSPKIESGAVDGRILAVGSVATEEIAYQAITHDKVGPDAITGDQIVESSLTQVPRASFADSATSAGTANPVAFAAVSAAGSVDSSLSKGIASADISSGGAGIYCIATQGFNAKGAQVTPRYDAANGDITAYAKLGPNGCSFPNVEVATFDGGVATNEAFYVVLYY
ncbi:MAG TPA: hypothetical protein VNM89_07930 [Solirubrobacterales bacterium]|nr:hypothetical protein [Solirubrobacterales bacterium]